MNKSSKLNLIDVFFKTNQGTPNYLNITREIFLKAFEFEIKSEVSQCRSLSMSHDKHRTKLKGAPHRHSLGIEIRTIDPRRLP